MTQADITRANALPAHEFLNMAAISNLFEIQSSEIARRKTHNTEVRQFAERMLHDHAGIAERLRTAARDRQVPSSLDQPHEQLLERLRSAPDASIDLAYVDAQFQAHREAVEIFDRYCQSGDDATLKRIAEETLPELRNHLQAVQQIQGNLELAARENGQRQPAPSVHVGQSSPQVSVQQAQPNVTVRQPQPEIHVRQPQPTITVEIPQPEITVRMPRPEVNVEMARPQVEVNQPKPQVQLEHQAGSQPQIRYEQAEARVIVKQSEGQPTIRYEPTGETPASSETPPGFTEEAQTNRTSDGQPVMVSQLIDLILYDTHGDQIGEVERVVHDHTGEIYIVAGTGGFLGIGKRILSIPANAVMMERGYLVTNTLTEEEISTMSQHEAGERAYTDLPGSQQIRISHGR